MASFFLDGSALAKRFVPETGSALVDFILENTPEHRIFLLTVGAAEVVSVLVRKRNAGTLLAADFNQAILELFLLHPTSVSSEPLRRKGWSLSTRNQRTRLRWRGWSARSRLIACPQAFLIAWWPRHTLSGMATIRLGRCQFTLRRLLTAIGVLGVGLGVLVGAARMWYWWNYPYGWSHCCDTVLWLALRNYADLHGGLFPAGEATPEASLSLLYPQLADANLLRGKTISLAAAQAALDKNGRLDSSSCDWRYIEGPTTSDDPGLALFWDKVGLGHNGQRLSGGGHTVVYLSGIREHIADDRWEEFLAEQDKLLNRRMPRAPVGMGAPTAP